MSGLFQVYSDIHLEIRNGDYPKLPREADNLILAGDIGCVDEQNYKDFIAYCAKTWNEVVVILGNHEFYDEKVPMESLKEQYGAFFSTMPNVHFLDNSFCKVAGVTIYGFTAWTMPIFKKTKKARKYLNDYHSINTRDGSLTVEYMANLAADEMSLFRAFLETNEDELIVVTHFPPLNEQTSDPIYKGEICNDYFTWRNIIEQNDLRADKIRFWISGHTHWSYNFSLNGIKYFANQIGYIDENVECSNGVI